VREAWLKDRDGKMLASYREHPMFVCPYSKPVRRKLSREELLKHVFFSETRPDAYAYNWRYAYDARLRLKDWGISIPKRRVDSLGDGPFEIMIDAETAAGEMLVGEMTLRGRRPDTLLFLSNYCHTGQANDSFSGLAMFLKVMDTLAARGKTNLTYKLLIMPETIGSAAYIAGGQGRLKDVFGAIFSEMAGYGDAWYIKSSRTGSTYMDILASDALRAFEDFKKGAFFELYGNDELIFDSVQVRIPSLSVQKFPFVEYHTSDDTVERINGSDLERAHDVVMHMVDVLERDAVFKPAHPVPFWMTRFDMYSDYVREREEHRFKSDIVYNHLDGDMSVLEIAGRIAAPFEKVFSFIKGMEENGLVRRLPASPWRRLKTGACEP
jgi:aminopeptidase-like protein